MTVELFETRQADTAEEFLDYFTPHRRSPLWRSDDSSWIFRGVRDAEWALEPSAFRMGEDGNPAFTRFKPGQLRELRYRTVQEQLGHEEHPVLDFAGRMSDAGFEVPGDQPELRTPEMSNLLPQPFDGRDFPPLHFRWVYALAQAGAGARTSRPASRVRRGCTHLGYINPIEYELKAHVAALAA
jgi:hypothetical protein